MKKVAVTFTRMGICFDKGNQGSNIFWHDLFHKRRGARFFFKRLWESIYFYYLKKAKP
jgi:hypothetical protein